MRIVKLLLLMASILLLSCTKDEEPEVIVEKKVPSGLEGAYGTYKGVFTTQDSKSRGIFELNIQGGVDNIKSGSATLTTHTGEVFLAKYVGFEETQKSSGFKLLFDSLDFSFTFNLDSNGEPLITDVVYKNQTGGIVAAQETGDTSVTPVTGTYRCTNCEDGGIIEGIELHNEERTFNILLTNTEGTEAVSIQSMMVGMYEADLLIKRGCTEFEGYTTCEFTNSDNATTEDVSWYGFHRYLTDKSQGDCSTLSGNVSINTTQVGMIEVEFQSDSDCPDNFYYVSPSGDDNNSGKTPQSAWKSLTKVTSVNLEPGDKVLFEGGKSFDGFLGLDENDAKDPSNPVTIASYGNGKATINAGSGIGIYAYNTAGVRIDNLIIKGSGSATNTSSGIMFYNDLPTNNKLEFIEIKNCEVSGFKQSGIEIGGWNNTYKNTGFNNILIENNKVYDILYAGITSWGAFDTHKTGYAHSNFIVRGCEVFNIHGNKNKTDGHSGNGIVLSDVQHSVIEHCLVYDSAQYNNWSSGGAVGIWYWDADSVIIQHNEVYGMSSGLTNKDGAGFDLDGGVTNGIMQYNYSHDNDGGGFIVGQFGGARAMDNVTVRYNVSDNDAKKYSSGIFLFSGAKNMQNIYIYNNTVLNSDGRALSMTKWSGGVINNVHVYNNILYGSIPSSGYNQSHNHTTNPDLDGFKLKSGSPLINSGMNLSYDIGEQDFFGNNPKNGVQDIGAHEY